MKFWNIQTQEKTLEEIVSIAEGLATKGKHWHFHILAPDCKLNGGDDFVLMVEDTARQEFFTFHTDSKPSEVGKRLVQLLHGKEVMVGEATPIGYNPSKEIREMVDRAKKLNDEGKAWHHHVLFPDCKFNTSEKWTILFEYPESAEPLRSVSDTEPKEGLKQIETLFYQGKS